MENTVLKTKKVMPKQFMEEHRDELRQAYAETRKKNQRLKRLTKKERKALGIGRDQGIAHVRHVSLAPIKANAVCKLIRGKQLDEAIAILTYTPRAVSPILLKLIKSAEANAVNNNSLSRDALYVDQAYANPGPVIKRIMPRARGSANRINKRTCHLTVVLKEKK